MKYLLRFAAILLLLAVGCINAQPALNAATKAERELGSSGEMALNSIAAASSGLTLVLASVNSTVQSTAPLVSDVDAILVDLHASTSAIKNKLDQPVLPYINYILGAIMAMILLHGVVNVWHHRKQSHQIRTMQENLTSPK